MIASLKLGSLTFPVNIIQGPLAGVSSAPFRALTWQHGHPAFSCTEMISAKTLLHGNKKLHARFVQKSPHEGPVCFQLASNNPEELGEAVKIATDYGADLIDLNCGCPVKKIRSKGAGSSLLTQSDKLYAMIIAMKKNTHVPISIKIRVQSIKEEKFNAEVARIVADAGADFLIVHGRHWTEHYETPCNYDEIQFFVEHVKMPVIGNGDIACSASLKKMFETGCAGVMIGRAGVGQPWLIQQLIAEASGEVFAPPSPSTIRTIFLEHVEGLIHLLDNEKFAILEARKLAKYYARTLPHHAAFCEAMNTCSHYEELIKVTHHFFN